MFTDMVGYTTLAQSDESLAMKVLESYHGLLRPIFPKYHGREVKTMGDSLLVEFDSALDATNCAIDIQQHLHKYNLSSRDDWKLRLRIGVHLGDVLRIGGDVLGDTVNVASRIEPLAEAEGICVSEQVFDQVRNKISHPFLKLAPTELKNVRFSIDVYKIVMPWEDGSATGLSHETPRSQRIAVLPLTNMSPDVSDEYFADGMTEEIISTLSKIEQAEVISRTSVMQYKKATKSIREVFKELNVGTILEGSVRKAGNRIRVAVQMIDAVRDRHLWAESYDRELEDVFAIQSDIARRVADALQSRMPRNRPSMVEPTRDVEAYTMYLRAMQLHHENTEVSLREAVALFEKAISRDPAFARAYAGLAHALCGLTVGYEDYTAYVKKAEAAARKSLELEPDSAGSACRSGLCSHIHGQVRRSNL
jgi:adenylate cyclase